MTLGVMFLVLRLANDSVARRWQPVVAFGRVPLFYYILHLYLIHGAATLLAWFQTGDYKWMFGLFVSVRRPAEFGFALAGVYAVWILIVLFLYPICKAYGDYKRRNTSVWLSYL